MSRCFTIKFTNKALKWTPHMRILPSLALWNEWRWLTCSLWFCRHDSATFSVQRPPKHLCHSWLLWAWVFHAILCRPYAGPRQQSTSRKKQGDFSSSLNYAGIKEFSHSQLYLDIFSIHMSDWYVGAAKPFVCEDAWVLDWCALCGGCNSPLYVKAWVSGRAANHFVASVHEFPIGMRLLPAAFRDVKAPCSSAWPFMCAFPPLARQGVGWHGWTFGSPQLQIGAPERLQTLWSTLLLNSSFHEKERYV